MASKRNPQTAAKRAREQAVRERRERKRAKNAEAAVARAAAHLEAPGETNGPNGPETVELEPNAT
jgi:hypothetical protein